MGVNGLGTGYPAWCNAERTRRSGADSRTAGSSSHITQSAFGDKVTQAKQAAGAAQPFVLHGKNDADEGETVVGSSVDAVTGVSIAVYKPKDFDPDNPVYHVKTWGAGGSMTERMVDISKVDPGNCDEIDMSAYAWHLSSSGQCPKAFLHFAAARRSMQDEQQKSDANTLFKKVNWIDIIRDFMQMQYDAHNMKGYLDYKELLGFMEKQSALVNAASGATAAGKPFGAEAGSNTKRTARQYYEQSFDRIAPNAPQRVKQAWLDAADMVGIDGMGVSGSGKLSHISQLMVRSIEKGYQNSGTYDLLGNSVQSAMRVAEEALYALEHPRAADLGRTAEQMENRRKEKVFYQEFIRRLGGNNF